MRTTSAATIPLLLAFAVGTVGCASDAAPDDGVADELTIGSINALTGDLGSYGPPMNRGIELAVQQINEVAGAHPGAMVATLETADSESRAEGAVAAARKLVGAGASCLLGPITTPEALAALNGVTKARKIAMFPAASSVALREEDDAGTIFRVIPPDDLQGKALARVVEDSLGEAAGKSVAFVYQKSAYGEGLLKSFGDAWEAAGGTIDLELGYAPTAPTFESEAQKLTARDFDAVIAADYPETFGKLSDALLRTGEFDPTELYVADALAVAQLPAAISSDAMEGSHGVRAGTVSDTDQAIAFDELATTDGERGSFDAEAFDAAMLCYLAAVAARSTDPGEISSRIPDIANAPGMELTYLQLPEAIEALQAGEDINYIGVSGPVEFGPNGDSSTALYQEFSYANGVLEPQRNFEVK